MFTCTCTSAYDTHSLYSAVISEALLDGAPLRSCRPRKLPGCWGAAWQSSRAPSSLPPRHPPHRSLPGRGRGRGRGGPATPAVEAAGVEAEEGAGDGTWGTTTGATSCPGGCRPLLPRPRGEREGPYRPRTCPWVLCIYMPCGAMPCGAMWCHVVPGLAVHVVECFLVGLRQGSADSWLGRRWLWRRFWLSWCWLGCRWLGRRWLGRRCLLGLWLRLCAGIHVR